MNLERLAPVIRERAAGILDALPIGETFDPGSTRCPWN